MQKQMQQMRVELDNRARMLVELEARPSSVGLLEVPDDAGIRDRERIIQHYKAKWDELQAENRQLKAMLVQEGENNIRIRMRSATNNQTFVQENAQLCEQALCGETAHFVEHPLQQCSRYVQEESQQHYSAHQEMYSPPQHTQVITHSVAHEQRGSIRSPPREYTASPNVMRSNSPVRIVEHYSMPSPRMASPCCQPQSPRGQSPPYTSHPAYLPQPLLAGGYTPRPGI